MHITPLLSNHRLARFTTWARLWLAWMAGALFQFAQGPLKDAARRNIADMAKIVECLILIGAAKRLPERRRIVGGPPRKRGWSPIRTVLGSRLHRRLRGRDLGKRVASLIEIVRDMDRVIAQAVRRIRRGFTRRRGSVRAPALAMFAACLFATPALADSS